jgi:hypothetical protein
MHDYIDDVLSINYEQFHSYLDSINPDEIENKDTIESSTSASYFAENTCRNWSQTTNPIVGQKG